MDVNKPIPGKPLTVMCVKCGKREGTERWVGDGGVLALTHGMYEMWCLGCLDWHGYYSRGVCEAHPRRCGDAA